MYEFRELKLPVPDKMLRRAWSRLCWIITRRIEHHVWLNTSGGTLIPGQIVALSYNPGAPVDNAIVLATAAASAPGVDAGVRWAGVVQDRIANNRWGNIRTDNIAYVLMENALAPNEGDMVYISPNVPGRGTLAFAPDDGEWTVKIGTIVDATPYVTLENPYVWVLLQNGCVPAQPAPL